MKFSDITGQEDIKQRLRQTVSDQRISHAQLFLGPEGSGKLAMALAYAQYINCRQRTADDSCGECPSCRKYTRLIHPDLHFIYPINKTKEQDDKKVTSKDFLVYWREFLQNYDYYVSLPDWFETIGIEKKQGIINTDEADAINRTLAYKAYEAEYKVMIMWMVEKLNIPSANKILKNLEEPPDKTLFLLIAEEAEEIIPTILSRTQLIRFQRLSDANIEEALLKNVEIQPEYARKISLLADGNYHEALNRYERHKADIEDADEEEECDYLELIRFRLFRDWMRACYTISNQLKDYEKLTGIITEIIDDGSREKLKETLSYALNMFHVCLQYNVGNTQAVRFDGEELDFIKGFSKFIHPYNIDRFEEEFNTAIFHIERNATPNIVITHLSLIISQILRIPASPQPKKV